MRFVREKDIEMYRERRMTYARDTDKRRIRRPFIIIVIVL